MMRKFGYAFFALLLLSALTTKVVMAKAVQDGKFQQDYRLRQRLMIGQVVRLGESDFDLQGLNDAVHTVAVTDGTSFRMRSEDAADTAAEFSDLSLGRWVGVVNRRNAGDGLTARLVVILPEDFDPSELDVRQAIGKVTQVNNGQGTFEVLTLGGASLTLATDEHTRYTVGIAKLQDLEEGLNVAVMVIEQADGTLLAKVVVARNPENVRFERIGGRVSAIGEDSLTVMTRAGEERTFLVTDETRIGSRNGAVTSLDELAEGMPVVVLVDRDGSPDEAVGVLALDEAVLALERVRGEVQSAGGSQLKLIVDGETLTFTVSPNARIQGRGITSLNDLKNGMKALVLYSVEENGTLLVKGIMAGGQPGN